MRRSVDFGGAVLVAAAITCPAAAPVLAETARLRPLAFTETLSERVPTSGALLVGLHIGQASGTFRPEAMTLAGQAALRGERVCLRVTTRDGRYRAFAQYGIAADTVERPALEFSTRHRGQIDRLAAGEFAARAVVAADCDDGTSGPLVPVALAQGAASAGGPVELVALINPGDAEVTARLVGTDGGALGGGPVRCLRRTQGASIVFSQSCAIALPAGGQARRATLELTVTEPLGGPRLRRFDIFLPRH